MIIEIAGAAQSSLAMPDHLCLLITRLQDILATKFYLDMINSLLIYSSVMHGNSMVSSMMLAMWRE